MYGTFKHFRSVAPSNPLFVDKPAIQIASNPLFWDKHRPNFGPSNPLFLDKKWPELPGAYFEALPGVVCPLQGDGVLAWTEEVDEKGRKLGGIGQVDGRQCFENRMCSRYFESASVSLSNCERSEQSLTKGERPGQTTTKCICTNSISRFLEWLISQQVSTPYP